MRVIIAVCMGMIAAAGPAWSQARLADEPLRRHAIAAGLGHSSGMLGARYLYFVPGMPVNAWIGAGVSGSAAGVDLVMPRSLSPRVMGMPSQYDFLFSVELLVADWTETSGAWGWEAGGRGWLPGNRVFLEMAIGLQKHLWGPSNPAALIIPLTLRLQWGVAF